MSNNQIQIVYIMSKLKQWNQNLGGASARRKMAASQFDALQQQFLIKRHQVQKMQNQKQIQGLTTKTASYGFKIKQGITQMQTAVGKMKQQHRRLTKKKTDSQQILDRKMKIVNNCEMLLKDIQQRQQANINPNNFTKPKQVQTLTDMRAKLLSQIQQHNYQIHQKGSDGHLTQTNQQQLQAMQRFRKKDQQIDDALDGIIDGITGVKQKVKNINKKQDQIIQKTNKNKNQITKVSKRIQTDNDKLKKIIKQFAPSRCCLWVVMLLLFIGLIVVAIRMFVLG